MQKRGQIQGQVLMYAIVAVIAILVVIFGYKAILGFRQTSVDNTYIDFQKGIELSLAELKNKVGAIQELELYVPADIDEVCFIDASKGDFILVHPLMKDYPIITDSLSSGSEQNIFFFTKEFERSMTFSTIVFDKYPYFYCVPNQINKIHFFLEARGRFALFAADFEVTESIENPTNRLKELISYDDKVHLRILPGTYLRSESGYVDEIKLRPDFIDTPKERISDTYLLSPADAELSSKTRLSFSYTDDDIGKEFAIYHYRNQSWTRIEDNFSVKQDPQEVSVMIQELGYYVLVDGNS